MIDPAPWLNRVHPGPRAERLRLKAAERRLVLDAVRPARAEQRVVIRGQILLLLVDGVGNEQTAVLMGVHVRTVERVRQRYKQRGIKAALFDALRPGRPPSLS